MALADIAKATKVLVAIQALPGALPGTAQWVSPFPDGSNSQTLLRCVKLIARSAATVTGHLVPFGATPTNANIFIPAMPLGAGDVEDIFHEDDEFPMLAGYSLFFFCSVASAINIVVTGNDIGGG